MYVHSVKLVNYKSFGNYQENEIILEPKVTAIIGKNESGKSNVLDGISQVNLTSSSKAPFLKRMVNVSCLEGEGIEYHLTLKPTPADNALGISENSLIIIKSERSYAATGSLLEYYNRTVRADINTLIEVLLKGGNNPLKLRDQELTTYNVYINELKREEYLNIPQLLKTVKWFRGMVDHSPIEMKDEYAVAVKSLVNALERFTGILPVFFYRKTDKHLKSSYTLEEVEKEIKTPSANDLLLDFIKVVTVSYEDFILAVKAGSDRRQSSLRDKIKRLVDSNINNRFQEFYQTEQIRIDLDFNSSIISILARSNEGDMLMLSERSNGLRWYLETFIDAKSHDIDGHNTVYLLDEPGTSLHVNAQREILRLFNDLADRGNQIVYTTHSPYMLNLEDNGMHRIRAVVKDKEGYSRIYKTPYDARIAPDSQGDTLAPIISALGMNLNDTFGPAKDKLNIVTEGMSDYIYLYTMARLIGIDFNRYAIIPAVGATNCVNICKILHGWGCKYIALFDYDKEGVESGGEYMRDKLLCEYGKQYFYVKEITNEELAQKTYKTDSYMIEDLMIRFEIDRYYNENGISKDIGKTLTAKLMCTAIENRAFTVGQECVDNFRMLFERIASLNS